jgi:hypothetical protein
VSKWSDLCTCRVLFQLQLTFVFSNLMGPWNKFESTLVRLKRSYENTGSVVCLTTKGRQLERNFEELKPAVTIASYLTWYDLVSNLCFMSFPVTADPATPQFLGWVLHWIDQHLCVWLSPQTRSGSFTRHTCNSIIRRHSERHVGSEKISPFITTVKNNIFSNLKISKLYIFFNQN